MPESRSTAPKRATRSSPTPRWSLSALVERADLDPNVHVILVSGRGEGFCAGFDLSAYAEGSSSAGGGSPYRDTVLSGKTQAINHLPDQPWDPMIDYQMMSRFVRGFSSLMHADKPTVVKIHGYCVAGGTDIALHADQVIAASDAKIGYPPMRVWGVPAAGLWAHRLGDQRAKRLLFTGDCITGAQAAEWGLAVEAPDPAGPRRAHRAPRRADRRGAGQPADHGQAGAQHRAAATRAWPPAGWSAPCSTASRGTPPRATRSSPTRVEHGFREAVRHRDEPFGDHGRTDVRGLGRGQSADADDRTVGGAERAARRPPGLGDRRELIRLTADFDIKEPTLRVALTRMVERR